MMLWLVVSHLTTFAAGAGATYLLTKYRPSGDHMHLDKTKLARTKAALARAGDRYVYIFGVLSLILAAGFAVFSVIDSRQQQDCFNSYANELADSLEPRQAASEARTTAQSDWQRAVADTLVAAEVVFATRGADTTDLGAALAEFRAADDALKDAEQLLVEERAANPYPQAPREVC